MRREVPLDILHLAAHCRNVPVTFTLDRTGSAVAATFEAAFSRSTVLYGERWNPPLGRDSRRTYGREVTAAIVADFRDGVVSSALDLPGNCFNAVREASYVLFEMGIDNTVTIGNVSVDGRPQFKTTSESLDQDMQKGFQPVDPVTHAHAWLTLDSGQVLDPTILPSWAYHDQGREIALEDAIFLSGLEPEPAVDHVPLLTGFSYHLHVLSHPILLPAAFKRFAEWFEHAGIFKRRIRSARAA